MLSDRNIFCSLEEGEKRWGSMPLGRLLFFWWSLAPDLRLSLGQTNTWCKLSVNIRIIFGRLAPIRQNLHGGRCRKLRGMQCNAISSTRARPKMPASFERHRFDRVTRADQSLTNKVKYSTVKCKYILAVLLCFAKMLRERCVEKYKYVFRQVRRIHASFKAR